MAKNTKIIIVWSIIGILIILTSIFIAKGNNTPSKYDSFVSCIKDKGALMYGAFWCPHCRAQKNLFGKSEKYLPYVECSTPDGNNQLAVCTEKKIESYPTWIFSDGSIESGELTLEKLAEKTSCKLP